MGGGKATKSVTHKSLFLQDSVAVFNERLSLNSGVQRVIEPSCTQNKNYRSIDAARVGKVGQLNIDRVEVVKVGQLNK